MRRSTPHSCPTIIPLEFNIVDLFKRFKRAERNGLPPGFHLGQIGLSKSRRRRRLTLRQPPPDTSRPEPCGEFGLKRKHLNIIPQNVN